MIVLSLLRGWRDGRGGYSTDGGGSCARPPNGGKGTLTDLTNQFILRGIRWPFSRWFTATTGVHRSSVVYWVGPLPFVGLTYKLCRYRYLVNGTGGESHFPLYLTVSVG